MQIGGALMNYCVYRHTFPNGKVYIGITGEKAERRWAKGHGYKNQPYIYNAIKKFGWDNIKHEILLTCLSKEEAENKEVELIAKYKSNQREYGYNIANGGCSTGMVSEETKRQISQKLKGVPKEKPPWKGKKHSLETKMKLRSKRLGELNPMYGRHVSEETREKMRLSHMQCSLCKSIICLETGQIFVSATEAARQMGLSQGNIASVARGERKHTKGFHFKYIAKEVTH